MEIKDEREIERERGTSSIGMGRFIDVIQTCFSLNFHPLSKFRNLIHS